MTATFKLSVVTPEREVLATEARFVALPADDGEIGILPHRAALLTRLGSGNLRVEEGSGARRTLFVSGGVAQMLGDKLTLLTQEAREPESITADVARQAHAAASALPRATDAQAETRARAETRAQALGRIARSHRD